MGAEDPRRAADLSSVFDRGVPAALRVELVEEGVPSRDATSEVWVQWLMTALATPRIFDATSHKTPGALSVALHAADPLWLPGVCALGMIRDGLPLDPGLLGERVRWTPGRLLALLVQLRKDGLRQARRQTGRLRGMARPSVIAARMSLMRCGEAVEASMDTEKLRRALKILEHHAPTLLGWVSRRNRALAAMSIPHARSARRLPEWLPPGFEDNVLLPRHGMTSAEVCPVDTEGHAIVVGAGLTLLKAVCDSACEEALQDAARNFELARDLSGGFFPSETEADLAFGECLALHCLQHHLQGGFGPAEMRFTTFDDREVTLTRGGMSGDVRLKRDGVTALAV